MRKHKKNRDNKGCCNKNCSSLFFVISLLAVFLWMTVIFLFSAEPANASSALSQDVSMRVLRALQMYVPGLITDRNIGTLSQVIEFPIRKLAHFLEYAVLGFLINVHLCTVKNRFLSQPAILNRRWLPILISCLYAVTDEVHQLFVPGRAGRLFDVFVDTAGAAFGTLIFFLLFIIIKKLERRR